MFGKITQWYKNLIARWNHERTLRRFAKDSPFTLREIREAYSRVHVRSYERLEKVINLAQRENISLWIAVNCDYEKETESCL